MLNKELLKAVELPKNGKNVIAAIYHHWKMTDINTDKAGSDREFVFLANGELVGDEYAFAFILDNSGEVEKIPLSGYKKEEDFDHDWFEVGDTVKVESEYIVLDYFVLNTSVLSKDGETVPSGKDVEGGLF